MDTMVLSDWYQMSKFNQYIDFSLSVEGYVLQ